MEFLADLGLFTTKTIVIVGSILVILSFLFQASSRNKTRSHIDIEKLNHRFRSLRRQLQGHTLSPKALKATMKEDKKNKKKNLDPKENRIFVLDFEGDIRASGVSSLREEVTAILSVAKPQDEVVVRLESGGGMVTTYGLAASQLARFKPHQIKLTVCVDKVAASGGYMMACVADQILCAPWAIVGSIGVIAQVPNFHRLLKKHDIDYNEVTAGEFKRTVTVFGEITEPGFNKFKAQIEDTHGLFKTFVSAHRPHVDINLVATGEHWYGTQAKDMGLIDQILTSDDYLFERYETTDILKVQYLGKRKLSERLSDSLADLSSKVFFRVWSILEKTKYD